MLSSTKEYTKVTTDDVVVKSLNRVKSFVTYSTRAAKYTTMYKDQQIPNDTATITETEYVITEQ